MARAASLKIVSQVPPHILTARLRQPLHGLVPLSLALVAVLATVSAVLAQVGARRQRAERALVRRTRQFEAIRAVTAEITRELDLPTLLLTLAYVMERGHAFCPPHPPLSPNGHMR